MHCLLNVPSHMLKRILPKLTTVNSLSGLSPTTKEIDVLQVGSPLSATVADTFLRKMLNVLVLPTKSFFCKRSIDDTYNRFQQISLHSYGDSFLDWPVRNVETR